MGYESNRKGIKYIEILIRLPSPKTMIILLLQKRMMTTKIHPAASSAKAHDQVLV
jgi:hypothetical protein